MTQFSIRMIATWILLGLPALANAAAPKIDYHFPAGGQRGTKVQVSVTGSVPEGSRSWVDRPGVTIAAGKKNTLEVNIAADAEPGVYWFRLFNSDGASSLRPFIVGTLPEVAEKNPNDGLQQRHDLDSTRVVVNGKLEKSGDVDVFAVKLKQGQLLIASLQANEVLGSPMDAVLQVTSATGFVLGQNHDFHGLDPQLTFKAPGDSTYLVRVFAFPSKPNTVIRFSGAANFIYRLTLTTDGFVDYAFPLAVPHEKPGSVDLIGWNIPDELKKFPVQVKDKKPGEIMQLFDARLANPFSVRLEPHAAVLKGLARPGNPQLLPVPCTVSGRIYRPGETDVYQFVAQKNQSLAIRIEAASLGFVLDPVLELYDEAGKSLRRVQSNKLGVDPLLDYRFTKEGKFLLVISDLHGDAGQRHVYRLTIKPQTPDFSLSAKSDQFTTPVNKPLDIPIAITAEGGFKGLPVFEIEGAGKSVKLDVVKGKSNKAVTLKLTASAPFSGPIRILGKAKDISPRPVRVTIADLNVESDRLWLTVK